MKILKLTPQQSQELIALNNQSGKHLVICDHGAGISINSDYNKDEYASQDAYIKSENLSEENIIVTEEEKALSLAKNIFEAGTASYPPLPSSGTISAGVIYTHNDMLILARKTHTRTMYDPNLTPDLFSFWRENAEAELSWIVGEKVERGWKRVYKGKTYKCIQAHQTLEGMEPDITPALWKEVVEGIGVWIQPTGAHDAYNIGDKVHFPTMADPVYESKIDANVWSPTVLPSAWKLV